MSNRMFVVFKIVLSIPIAYGLAFPFFSENLEYGIFAELQRFGVLGASFSIIFFLSLVYLYARDLKKSLELVDPSSRKATPSSVWWMLVLPYNFIEDFFIIANVSRSLRSEAKSNARLSKFHSFGMISGIGWCVAQVVSLFPNFIGSIAGLLAIVLWIWHWIFICQVNSILRESSDLGR